MRIRFAIGLVAALLASVSTAVVVHADAGQEPRPATTLIVLAPKTESNLPVSDLMTALSSQLEELGISVVLSSESFTAAPTGGHTHENDRNVLAFVWLVEHDGILTVHFYEAAGASLRERRIPVSGTEAVSLEEVAIVVRSAVSAVLERAEKQKTAPAPAQPAFVKAPPLIKNTQTEKHARSPVALGLGLTLSRYSAKTPYQLGPRGSINVGPPDGFWEVGLAYTYVPVMKVEDPALTMTLSRHPIELFIAADYRFTALQFFVGGSLGLVLDPIKRRTIAADDETTASDDQWRTNWATALQLRAGWFATSLLRIYVSGGSEILLKSHDQVLGGDEPRVLLSPFPVRPILLAGISCNLP